MGACCEKQQSEPNSSEFQDNLVREQTNAFHEIYEIVGEPLGTGSISTIRKIRKKDSALGGSSQKAFVRRRRRQGTCCCRGTNTNKIDADQANILRGPETYYALKEIDVKKVKGEHAMRSIRNEVEVLKKLDHPAIVRAFETFDLGHSRLAIVMELCRGGDLSTRKP